MQLDSLCHYDIRLDRLCDPWRYCWNNPMFVLMVAGRAHFAVVKRQQDRLLRGNATF